MNESFEQTALRIAGQLFEELPEGSPEWIKEFARRLRAAWEKQGQEPVTAVELAHAWMKYEGLFGRYPNGTVQQLSALLELLPQRIAAPVAHSKSQIRRFAAQGTVPEMVSVPRDKLDAVFNALDRSLGDTDVTHIETDEEMQEEVPVQWACTQVSIMLAAPNAAPGNKRLQERMERIGATADAFGAAPVTTYNEQNEAVAVTLHDAEGRILKVLWERPAADVERDARRYRWLRDNHNEQINNLLVDTDTPSYLIDAAIDAAIDKEGKK